MAYLSKLLHDVADLDTLINIRSFTSEADATGGFVDTWSNLATDVWAKIEYQKASNEGMRGENEQVVAWNTITFTIRDFFTLNETMRIVYESNEYDILSISKIGRSRFLVIEGEKRDNAT